eukprot:CAMPEP_0174737570 /NCGR_PEP_ID=MMETSP1094-20130205/68516_1 /TAXON_ID=156173 /ORGANISM="Chrysochromulina brevifilum, Strain UTEX LB 985" /LENGTH=36 /DNA_ID= /DNA_START= /DNA_END= /DNA_ORIENTATION=
MAGRGDVDKSAASASLPFCDVDKSTAASLPFWRFAP